MKLKTMILTIILVFGLLGVPNCIFAQEGVSSDAVLQSNIVPTMQLNSLNPEMKGGSRGSSSSSKSSTSKALKKIDGDDDDTDGSGDGSGGVSWLTVIIILVVILGIIGFLVWFFLLRK